MAQQPRLVVIGAGPGGYVAALRAAQLGGSVTLIEESEVGGTCLNKGCIPSKALIHGAEVLSLVRRAGEYGVRFEGTAEPDIAKMVDRKRRVVSIQVKGIQSLLKNWGVRFLKGRGRLGQDRRVIASVNGGQQESIGADRVILAAGSIPSVPSIFPYDGRRVITSEEALEPTRIPGRLLIVGAGVEGCEFACLYRALGSDVTLLEMKNRVLPLEDEEISTQLSREMGRQGIRVMTGVRIEAATAAETVTIRLATGEALETDQLLVSVGRRPNSEKLGLAEAGIRVGPRGEVQVNDFLETSVSGIFAIGDLLSRIMLAHVASAEGKIAAWNAVSGKDVRPMDYSVVPAGIFTSPEIGTVGLKEHEARLQFDDVTIGRFQYRALGRSHTTGEISGFFKVLSAGPGRKVIGAHLIGAHASELIHEVAVAMRLGARAEEIGEMIHAHPTLSEGLMEAMEDLSGRAIHAPRRQGT